MQLLNAVDMPTEQIAKEGFGPALVETTISYKTPLYLGDTVTANIWISKLRGASANMDFEFFNLKGDVAASGSQRGLFIDLTSKKPKRLSDQQRSRFVTYLIEPDA